MNRAVFIDRDGTMIKHVDLLRSSSHVRLLPRASSAMKILNQLNLPIIMITNQPVVARGLLKEHDLDKIHEVLIRRLKKYGVNIDAVYYCPHHPNANLKEYRKKCSCRKPEAGMIHSAAKDFKINLNKSFMIGDTWKDIAAGNKAGATTILVQTGDKKWVGQDYEKADYEVNDLHEAAHKIKKILQDD